MLQNTWSMYRLEHVSVIILAYLTATKVAGLNICTHMTTTKDDMPTGNGAAPTVNDAMMRDNDAKSTGVIDASHSNVSDSDTGFGDCLGVCRRYMFCTAVSFDRRARLCYLHFDNGRIYERVGSIVPSVMFGYLQNHRKASEQQETNSSGIKQLLGQPDTTKYHSSTRSPKITDRRTTVLASLLKQSAPFSHPVGTQEPNSLITAAPGPLNQHGQGTDEVIGSACSSDAGCTHINGSLCTTQRCQCPFPLGYSTIQKACVLCKTFKQIQGHKVDGYNSHVEGLDTLEECKSLCMDERRFICNSFDYCLNTNKLFYRILTKNKPACLLSTISLSEAMSKKVISAVEDCVIGYRVCQ